MTRTFNSIQASEDASTLIKTFEGLALRSYRCPAGYLTIGYGHVVREGDNLGPELTKEQADTLLREDLSRVSTSLNKLYCSLEVQVNQHQHDALCSFTFNTGPLNWAMRERLATKDLAAVGLFMLLYTKAGGKVLPGLVKRRQAEYQLFIRKP